MENCYRRFLLPKLCLNTLLNDCWIFWLSSSSKLEIWVHVAIFQKVDQFIPNADFSYLNPSILHDCICLWKSDRLFYRSNCLMGTKLGRPNIYHKNFRFASENLHSSDDVIRFCRWRHQNLRFWRMFRSCGKNCVVTFVFVVWSWLTPQFKAKRLRYNIQVQ